MDLNPSSNSPDRPDDAFASTRFVLVEPSYPGNVGAAARALKTMGFSRLVGVAPKIAFVTREPEAIAMASGTDDVLASAQVVETLADGAFAGIRPASDGAAGRIGKGLRVCGAGARRKFGRYCAGIRERAREGEFNRSLQHLEIWRC